MLVQILRRTETSGFTLIELIACTPIWIVLAGMAVPLASFSIKRERERALRSDIWEMRVRYRSL